MSNPLLELLRIDGVIPNDQIHVKTEDISKASRQCQDYHCMGRADLLQLDKNPTARAHTDTQCEVVADLSKSATSKFTPSVDTKALGATVDTGSVDKDFVTGRDPTLIQERVVQTATPKSDFSEQTIKARAKARALAELKLEEIELREREVQVKKEKIQARRELLELDG